MTEGQDACAAPVPRNAGGWPGAAAAGPPLPGGIPAAGPPAVAGADTAGRPVAGLPAAFAELPMPAPVPASSPGALAASAEQGGTGWPGDARAGSPAESARSRASGWPSPGPMRSEDAEPTGPDERPLPPGPPVSTPGSIWTRPADAGRVGAGPAAPAEDEEPFARVDARKLEAALLGLRHPIVTVPLVFDSPGVTGARAERVKLLSQIDDYLLPRLRQSGAPILVALVGSTSAGKSTLLNSLVGKQVSATGIRRPTTNSPVLACHPDDARWFAENVFLPTLPRVRQQGLAMPGRDGLLVLAASEGMPRGVAVLDTPDIDSVVQAHRDFAHQFLDASDLWLFVTTARRYADAAVWEMLQDARDRGAALAGRAVEGADARPRPSSRRTSTRCSRRTGCARSAASSCPRPPSLTRSSRPTSRRRSGTGWLIRPGARTAGSRCSPRRCRACSTRSATGCLPSPMRSLSSSRSRASLRQAVESVFAASLAEFDAAIGDGSLLRGEVLARWQDFASTGDLLRTLQVRRGRGAKQKKVRMPARAAAVKAALQASMVSLVTATADRAAELVVADWQQLTAGAALLAEVGPAGNRGADGTESAEADFVATALADLGLVTGGCGGQPPGWTGPHLPGRPPG